MVVAPCKSHLKMNKVGCAALYLAITAVVLLEEAMVAKAVVCNPTELQPCFGALVTSAPPSAICCGKTREQAPCLCTYYKNPSFNKYVNSPRARMIVRTCGVAVKCKG
ncbi:hypothetical protein Ancab_006348 [Ancistrocladus abbreviatus]